MKAKRDRSTPAGGQERAAKERATGPRPKVAITLERGQETFLEAFILGMHRAQVNAGHPATMDRSNVIQAFIAAVEASGIQPERFATKEALVSFLADRLRRRNK